MQIGYVRLVNGSHEKLLPCSHIEVTRYPGEGIHVQVMPGGQILKLPEDGQSIYVMNNINGETIDSYHWPERKRKEFRNV